MNEITYKKTKDGEAVLLSKKRVGMIKPVSGGYAYFPKGSKTSGQVFSHVSQVKHSLELDAHACQYLSDGGPCQICGKTASEGIEVKNMDYSNPCQNRLPSGTIVLTITPDSNIDYTQMRVIDDSITTELRVKRGEPLNVRKNGRDYIYEPDDIQIKEHLLIHNGVAHKILHRLTVG
jgi:hypothetical protein